MKLQLKQGIGCALRRPERPWIANPRLARSRPLARPYGPCSRSAPAIPFAVSQTAQVSRLPAGATPNGLQQGIALVITLIMLSVITFMAVTFLVVSRHEAEAVTTTTDQNVSRFGADGALQMAEAQIAAMIMANTNGYNFPYLVSTNYVTNGFTTGVSNLYNISYYYPNGGGPLNPNDQMLLLANLLFLPRPPVFIVTNKNQLNPEFRFFVDENGNGIYDTNGPVVESLTPGGPPLTNYYSGDPEWIGFLEHPELRHSPTNQFLARGAFIAQPIGNSLDINYIHSQAKFLANGTLAEGFFRNEGMGSWEMNLAAFLQNLNTNVWGAQLLLNNYVYNTNLNFANEGTAFLDASEIMRYRYNGSYLNLNSFQGLYGGTAARFFDNDSLDGYGAGILMTGTGLPRDIDLNYLGKSWSGADNPLQFVRPRDLFNLVPPVPASSTPSGVSSFTNNLSQVGLMYSTAASPPSITNSYNRYTFYRLLSQMGVGSAPEPAPYPIGGSITSIGAVISGIAPANAIAGRNQMSYGSVPEAFPYPNGRKMNLNYVNVSGTNATNFIPWTTPGYAVAFFTNAADRLLRSYFPTNFALLVSGRVVVTNLSINFIPIYPVNYYTPAVHRMLQLAANMYDAGTNKAVAGGLDYPSVFKPYFGYIGSVSSPIVYISGYTEQQPTQVGSADTIWNAPLDLRRPANLSTLIGRAKSGGADTFDNVYGAPYVVGARTNLPNFNEFSMASVVNLYRTLQLSRTAGSTQIHTNVSYVIGISNVVGVQCWNSYTNYLFRPSGIRILGTVDFTMQYSNTFRGSALLQPTNQIFGLQQSYTLPVSTNINPWQNGVSNGNYNIPGSFAVPIMTNLVGLSNGSYVTATGTYTFSPTFLTLSRNYTINNSYIPDWGINVTNRVRLVMLDNATGRVLDCVQLGGLGQLAGLDAQDSVLTNLLNSKMSNYWDPTPISASNNMAKAIFNQIATAESLTLAQQAYPLWQNASGLPGYNNIPQAISSLSNFLVNTGITGPVQVGFPVPGVFAKVYTWSANDPLVHYTVGDLTDMTKSGAYSYLNQPNMSITSNSVILTNLYTFSPRYQPWGINSARPLVANITAANQLYYKDPLIGKSSDWQFPSNKYPNIGWLGRVHRGTPWQTVDLKPSLVDTTTSPVSTWQVWTGNPSAVDAATAQPTNDWQMLDLFTTAPNDNASRGQLSVNQSGIAAWSSVLDGVMVVSNNVASGAPVATNIDTTQTNGPGQTIINGINSYRASLPNQTFTSLGQILGAPVLTVNSPYLNTSNPNDPNLTDAVYERIPQQIASLLRVGTPRYAIYAYGQSLKPANGSIYQQSGPYFGMCTNYQITGEAVTRTIVRFDNMPVPGYPPPGASYAYALQIQNANPATPEYVIVTNTMPPMKAVVESFEVLGPDQ